MTDNQKFIYRTMAAGITACAPKITLPLSPMNEALLVFEHVLLDNPLLFYTSSFRLERDLGKGKCFMRPDYQCKPGFVRQTTRTVLDSLHVFNAVKADADIGKIRRVHDWCVDNLQYDDSPGNYSYSVLGPVLNRMAVCEGIAKFAKLSLDYLGVRNFVARGKVKSPLDGSVLENHAWNVAAIGGALRHFDVTFDLAMNGQASRHDYFNLSDAEIKKDHLIVSDVKKGWV